MNENKYDMYIKNFNYNPLITIKKLLKGNKITQSVLAEKLKIDERNVRNYLSGKTKVTKDFLLVVCSVLELPLLTSLELFNNCGLHLTMNDKDPEYFEILKNIEKN